jgi:mannose-1-phosphate guanylyltransferase
MIKGVLLSPQRADAFRPLTFQSPFALLPLVDRPLIEHQVEFLARNGVPHIRLSCSHLANLVEQHCGGGGLWGASISYTYERSPFGAVGALRRMEAFFHGSTLVVMEGDVVPDIDLELLLAFHALHRADATFVCTMTTAPSIGLTLALDGAARIRAVRTNSSPAATPHLADGGIAVLEPEMLDLLPGDAGPGLLQACWKASEKVRLNLYGYQTQEPVLRLQGWKSYYKAQMDILEGRVPGIRVPGTEIREGIWMGDNVRAAAGVVLEPPVLVGDGCVLGANARIGRGTVLGRYSSVEPAAVVERALVLPRTRVARRTELTDVIVRGNLIIDIQRNVKRLVERPLPPPARRRGRAGAHTYHLLNRVAALVLILLLLPVFAGTFLFLLLTVTTPLLSRVRRLGVELATLSTGGLRLRVFDLFYLGPPAPERNGPGGMFDPPMRLPRVLARLGNLLNVLTGDILLVGNRPMDPELAFSMTEEWERRRFTCQTGFISVLDSVDTERLSETERYVTEANYAVYRNVGTDLAILWKAVQRRLVTRLKHQQRGPRPLQEMVEGSSHRTTRSAS